MFKPGFVALVAFASSTLAQVAEWGQCGGIGWTGGTTCVSSTVCTVLNPYYSQCLPPTTTAAPPPPPPTTTVIAPPPPPPPSSVSSASAPASSSTGLPPPATDCPVTSFISGYNNAFLPNPFVLNDGTPVTTKAQFACKQQQILALVQGYEAGFLPGKPTIMQATFSKSGTTGTLAITTGFSNKTVAFSPTITYPSGTAPAGGWPLMIGLDGASIPIPAGIATITYNADQIGLQNDGTSRGQGLFFTLYGSGATASAMTAWAWGVSRIIDALELNPSAGINLSRIGLTGCSRDGKGALTVGAFEPRIALTIPQESGAGGDTCWRLTKNEADQGGAVQTSTEIVGENVWFSAGFANYVSNLNTLPYDHHLLAALIAPRALLSFENTDYEWLAPMSAWGCVNAAHTVFTALGVPDHHGFVQAGGHAHCAFPSSQTAQLDAFINRFLLGQNSTNTNIFTTNNVFNGATYNQASWINWATPTLT